MILATITVGALSLAVAIVAAVAICAVLVVSFICMWFLPVERERHANDNEPRQRMK